MLGELTETQILNVLSSQALGRLACTDGLKPYIVPLTYHYDGKYIYSQTKEGTKLDILRKNANVCFETDVMTDMANWKCVLVFGKFEELDETESQNAREILFDSLYSLMTSSTLHAHEHEVAVVTDDSNRIKPVMFRIAIEKMTGRYESR
jgi:nitroimidazol reductase NimA-like FMN-containing flavoprotein (pyridoxamine 5'-phosphate oxidase superfamily)